MKRKELEWLTSVDLEMNQTETESRIIQIGYCIFNIKTGQIKLQKSLMVNPHELLAERIITLTGIKQHEVDKGYELKEAYNILVEDHKAYADLCNPVTWGGGDVQLLEKQLGIENGSSAFGRRWIDVKTLVVAYKMSKGIPIQGGLASTMRRFKILPRGSHHNAEWDAVHTALTYVYILNQMRKIELDRGHYDRFGNI